MESIVKRANFEMTKQNSYLLLTGLQKFGAPERLKEGKEFSRTIYFIFFFPPSLSLSPSLLFCFFFDFPAALFYMPLRPNYRDWTKGTSPQKYGKTKSELLTLFRPEFTMKPLYSMLLSQRSYEIIPPFSDNSQTSVGGKFSLFPPSNQTTEPRTASIFS